MLQNSRVATSIISELLTENQQKERRGGRGTDIFN